MHFKFKRLFPVGLALLLAAFLFASCAERESESVYTANKHTSFSAQTVTVEADVATLRICAAQEERATIRYFENGNVTSTFSEKDGEFSFTQHVLNKTTTKSGEITLLLPQAQSGEFTLTVRTSVGKTEVFGINFLSLDLSSSVGNISVREVSAPTLRIRTNTGDIQAERIRSNDAALSTDVGDVTLSVFGEKEDYSVTGATSVGKKDFENQTGKTEKSLSLTAAVGSLRLNFLKEE